MQENNIDPDRIVDGDSIPDNYVCSICHCLLWKPRSCSSCQHLFCEKCIETWLKNPISAGKCPFQCEKYVDGPCSSLDRSLLSNINIHCRNKILGCTEIVCYDQLERHETVECQYVSQRCAECDQLVLLSHVDIHRQLPGLCIPRPIKCTICKSFIEKVNIHKHIRECRVQELYELFERASSNHLTISELIYGVIQYKNQLNEMGRSITTLKGFDAVQRIREQNGAYFYYLLIMIKFFLQNWSKIPILMLTVVFTNLLIFIAIAYCFLLLCVKHFGSVASICVILLTILLTYGSSLFIQSVSDQNSIICLLIFNFIFNCFLKIPLEMIEIESIFNMPKLTLFLCCLTLFSMKIILLLIRFYFSLFWVCNSFFLLVFISCYLSLTLSQTM